MGKVLKIWLTNPERPELVRLEFELSGFVERRLSVRGKTRGAHSSECGTFQWTSAVQALTALLLNSAASNTHNAESGSISGEAGSTAASLDYAISKPPVWLIEMFGVTVQGEAFARRLFRRTNPERKRPGPVVITLNDNLLPPQSIEIYLNDARVNSVESIRELARKVDTSEHTTYPGGPELTNKVDTVDTNGLDAFCQSLADIFERETQYSFSEIDIFHEASINKYISKIYADESVNRRVKKPFDLVHRVDRELLHSERIGGYGPRAFVERTLKTEKPLRVAVAVGQTSSLAIFWYLKFIKGYNIEIECEYHYAIEIMKQLLETRGGEPPELCILGIAPAITLMQSRKNPGFAPFMLVPGMSHRLMSGAASSTDSQDQGGEFLMLYDEPSTSLYYFEELLRNGTMKKSRARIRHAEPDEISNALNGQSDLKAIVFAPYTEILRRYAKSTYVDNPTPGSDIRSFLLFAHQSLTRDVARARAINIAIRDAWLTLKNNPTILRETIVQGLKDARYVEFITRCAGITLPPTSQLHSAPPRA